MKKTGRLSKTEWDFIQKNADTLSAQQIANHLGRELEPVVKYMAKIGKSPSKVQDYEIQAEYDLKNRLYWKEIKNQFSEEEQEMFLYQWSKIVGQFKKDIFPTEELQILHLIKIEILLNRNLRERQLCYNRIADLEKLMIDALKQDPRDPFLIGDLDRQIALAKTSVTTLTGEYKDLQTKVSAQLKELKATRDQRIEKIENSKQTFSGLLVKIARDNDFRDEMSKYMEKMRLAMNAEKVRLSDYHTYGDGVIDQPFLNSDTVL